LDTVCHKQLHFGSLFSKEIIGDFEGGRITSDGGGLLLREVDQRYHLSERLAACLQDSRIPERITHELSTLLKLVGHSRSDYPIHPSCQYCRGLPPPIRMNDDNTVSQWHLLTMQLDFWRQGCIFRELAEREYGVEMLLVQVVSNDFVTIVSQRFWTSQSNGMIETGPIGVGNDYQDFHIVALAFSASKKKEINPHKKRNAVSLAYKTPLMCVLRRSQASGINILLRYCRLYTNTILNCLIAYQSDHKRLPVHGWGHNTIDFPEKVFSIGIWRWLILRTQVF
jgi:hypothetical protein